MSCFIDHPVQGNRIPEIPIHGMQTGGAARGVVRLREYIEHKFGFHRGSFYLKRHALRDDRVKKKGKGEINRKFFFKQDKYYSSAGKK
jgi:hypothetical protein